jgi:hypothetical protein
MALRRSLAWARWKVARTDGEVLFEGGLFSCPEPADWLERGSLKC